MRRTTDSRARGGRASLIVGLVMLAVGMGLFAYPTVSAIRAQMETDDALASMREEGTDTDAVSDDTTSATTAGGEGVADVGHATDAEKAADTTYQQLKAYNEKVRDGEGDAINDPFAFDDDSLAKLGLPDGIVGSLDIPAMGVTLPLYLGSSYDHMAQGATVVAGTSMPLGETDSNVVIAAHRGVWQGLTMFRDIEKLEKGDTLTLTTPWDTLTYRVTGFEVILPDDTDAVAIQPGRDMVTLLTCHPYGQNAHRLLVYCERVDDTEAEASGGSIVQDIVTQLTPDLNSTSPLLTIEGVLKLAGLGILVALGLYLIVDTIRRRRK